VAVLTSVEGSRLSRGHLELPPAALAPEASRRCARPPRFPFLPLATEPRVPRVLMPLGRGAPALQAAP